MRNLRQGNGAAPTDLVAELRELARSMSLGVDLRVEVISTGEARSLPELTSNHVFRVAQEALTNAIRHGHAKYIHVEVAFAASMLTLRIADDGTGFNPAAARGTTAGHFGLHGMRERAQRLGGTLTKKSRTVQCASNNTKQNG